MPKWARFPGSTYLLALLVVAAAAALNLALTPYTRLSLPLYLIAVMVAARAGGLGPSLVAAAVSLVVQDVIRSATDVSTTERVIRAAAFLVTAVFVSSLVARRRRAEERERARRVWYEAMLLGVGDAVVAADAEGRVSFLNAAAEALTGWPAQEAVGRPVESVITPGRPTAEHPARAALRSGEPSALGRSATLVDREGRARPIDGHAAPIRTMDGRTAGAVLVFRDAAERRRGEEAASELAAIVASSSDAIICRGTDDRITSWNPGAERLFGYTAAEAIGRPISILLPPDRTDEMPRMLTRIDGGAPVTHYETERLGKDGHRIDISVSVSPLRDGEGRIVGMATIARDVSERRQSERRLAAQYAVGRVLSESATVDEAMPRMLESLGTTLRWDVAVFWRPDAAAGVLRFAHGWHRGRPGLEAILDGRRPLALAPGEDVPGRVWAGRAPAWVEDVQADAEVTRTARPGDPRAVAAFPIVQGDDVLGVVELMAADSRPADESQLVLLNLVGTQAGLFIERKRAEDELRKAEARFRPLAESNILCIAVADVEAHLILDANDCFLDLLGATREQVASGMIDWAAMTPPEYREVDARAVAQVLETGACDPFVKEYVGFHGRRVSVLLGAALLEPGTSRCIVFLIDITERRRAEDALRHREEQLRLAFDAARMGSWDWNLDTGEVEWSEQLEEIFGLEPGDFPGTIGAFFELTHPDDHAVVRAAIDRALDGDGGFEAEYRVVSPRGATPWISSRGRVFRDGDGRPARMVGVAIDVTGRKRAEADLQAAKDAADAANRAKDQFLAVLSHELRTPLTPVLAAVAAMHDDATTPEDYRSVLAMVRRNVELEARLIDDLLDVTRISSGKLRLETRAVDAHELLYQALEICMVDIRDKGLHLALALDATGRHVEADPARLQQVYWNLIKNAVKFTPSGGSLAIRTSDGPGGRLAVEVSDSGLGIEPEVLTRIFNAFDQGDAAITRRFGGLGLGLAISRSVVEALGGSLSASSAGRDRGSSFRIEMPSVAAPPPPAEDGRPDAPEAESDGDLGPLRILLVEDNEDSLRVLSRLLRAKGHEVVAADTVASAVAAAEAGPIDLLVSDLGLPDGSGHDVIAGVRRRSDCPAIALSGYGMESDMSRSRGAGFSAHLVKPVDIDQLAAAIRRVVVSAAGAEEAGAR